MTTPNERLQQPDDEPKENQPCRYKVYEPLGSWWKSMAGLEGSLIRLAGMTFWPNCDG